MSKFKKRISKLSKIHPKDALVIGTAWGHLEELVDMFDTVFVYSKSSCPIKARNIIIRKDLKDCLGLYNLSAIFIDLDYFKSVDYISALLQKPSPEIFVEGNEVVPKTETKNLYSHNYNAVGQGGNFHQWIRVK